jgi:myo-inositol-1(or 4)-monophosphatase
LRISATPELQEALIGFDWARDEEKRSQLLARLQRVAPLCHTVRALGSAALGLTYVAAGWLDGYFHLALHPWDAAAAALLITEAGGHCTSFDGEPFSVSATRCVATNGRIHEALLHALRRTL